ncbi:MAG: Na-Ca exchanger/integrin-beta4, partial [bacterium]
MSTGLVAWGAGLVDVNDDGRLDAVTMNRVFDAAYPGSISVLDGHPGAVFGGGGVTISAPWGALSVSGADLDSDGLADLAMTTTDGCEGFRTSTITTRLGNGDATFGAPVTLNTGFFLCPRAMAIGKFNADPLADVAVTAMSTAGASVRSGTGGGAFGGATLYGGEPNADDVTAHDVDANGTLDLVLCDALGVSVLSGNGAGGFGARITSPAGASPKNARMADMDANGLRDAVVVNSSEDALSVLPGAGGGAFGARIVVATGDHPNGLDIGELTGDANPDLAVSCSDGTVRVHENLGGLNFGAGTVIGVAANPTYLQIADINGDGMADILTADSESATVSLFLGNG